MFGNDYKNEIDKIKPDGYIKDKVRRKLENGGKSPKVRKRAYFGTAVAAVLCGVMLLSVGGILGRQTAKIPDASQNKSLMKTVGDYKSVYKALEKFKPSVWDEARDFLNGFGYKNATDEIVYESYSTADMDGAAPTDDSNKGSAKPGSATVSTSGKDHSETTTQVEGVDEADIVKTDGEYIYILTQNEKGSEIKIVDVRGKEPNQLNDISITHMNWQEMYLSNGRLVLLGYIYGDDRTFAVIYDISNPAEPKQVEICSQSGGYNTSRLIGNRLYIISDYYIKVSGMDENDTESFVPRIVGKDYNSTVAPDCIYLYNDCIRPEYTVVTAFDIKDGKMLSSQSVLGGSYTVYASTENIITTSMSDMGETQVARFKLIGDEVKLTATGTLNGSLLNQFSIDEYNGYFRFVLTEYAAVNKPTARTTSSTVGNNVIRKNTTVNSLVILDGDLDETGKITDIAPDERVYSVRFMGDTAYFVTFRQVDPLFSVDVSNPKAPKIIGALKIPGFSNYLYPFGEGKLLGIGQNADEKTGRTGCIKLSMFDISNPADVTESDKTDINSYYSAALYNHKAILTDYSKNIISFAAQGNNADQTLYVFSYENGSFTERLSERFDIVIGDVRPLYIGDIFYAVTQNEIRYFNLNTLEKIGSMNIK